MTSAATTPLRQVAILVRSGLRGEVRAADVALVAVPFAVAALLVIAIAVGADVPLLRRIGPGVYWAAVLLFGTLVALRPSAAGDGPWQDLLALLGVDPATGFVARTAVTAVLLLAFEGLVAPVMVLLYDPGLGTLAATAAAGLLVAIGLAGLGTLAADLTSAGRAGHLLAPLLVVPLAVPLLIAAVEAGTTAVYGASPLPWLALAATVDAVVIAAGVAAAASLREA